MTISPRSVAISLGLGLIAATPAASALASSSSARKASRSERSAILSTYVANDGGTTGVYGVYVSRADSGLAVVCVRTPEAGKEAFVVRRSGRSWRYAVSGPAGRVGTAAERRLERAC